MANLKRVQPAQRCEKHHPVNYADEFNDVGRRLRVVRLALGGGPILLDEVGMEGDADENLRDAHAVLDLAEQTEQQMDNFTEERARCPICSPGAA